MSLYWHDYETFGLEPKCDRPAQFAGIRTDEELNIIGEPLNIYCKLTDDILPSPEACLITGITPQKVAKTGLNEAEFMQKIYHELIQPNTCTVGYNNLRFDDEFTRFGLYRNFLPIYDREWKNDNSRWDIIDLARMTYALRPDGINWAFKENGKPSFRLTDLTTANNISHDNAHDALADVYATINLAKLIRQKQPKLYDYFYKNRFKYTAKKILKADILIHISRMFPSENGCTALVTPIVELNKNEIVVYNLNYAPSPLAKLSIDEIKQRIFTTNEKLAENNIERIHLKSVHLNRCPALAPYGVLGKNDKIAERINIDKSLHLRHLEMIKNIKGLDKKITQVFAQPKFPPEKNPEYQLYGGFFDKVDEKLRSEISNKSAKQLIDFRPIFNDKRLAELFFRYLARNYPQALTKQEQQSWHKFVHENLQNSYHKHIKEIEKLLLDNKNNHILNELKIYANNLIDLYKCKVY
jgi:exodeoxyribonuclease-1